MGGGDPAKRDIATLSVGEAWGKEVVKKSPFSSQFSERDDNMKKLAQIVAFLVISITASYAVANDKNDSICVSFGEEFTIRENQTAFFKDTKTALHVKRFSKGVCAIPGSNCGSGWRPPSVQYDISFGGQILDLDSRKGIKRDKEQVFDVKVKESDYNTYAVMSVDRLLDVCEKENSPYCWEELAWATKDSIFCDRITEKWRAMQYKKNISQIMKNQDDKN